MEPTRYDFSFRIDFKFLSFLFYFFWITWFSKFILFMHMHMRDHDNMPVLYVPHQKKAFAKYRWLMHSRWQITFILIVSSSSMTYPPSGTHMFNAAWTSLHTLRECIHVLRKRPQDIPRSLSSRCAVYPREVCTRFHVPRLLE
jgi:hypothetical protein